MLVAPGNRVRAVWDDGGATGSDVISTAIQSPDSDDEFTIVVNLVCRRFCWHFTRADKDPRLYFMEKQFIEYRFITVLYR